MIIWKRITYSIEKIVRSSVQKTRVKMNEFPFQYNFLYVYLQRKVTSNNNAFLKKVIILYSLC